MDDDLRQSEVPSVVLNGFKEKFPNASGVEWEKKADGYEVEFKLRKSKYLAQLNKEGVVIQYNHPINFRELPEAIQDKILVTYDQARIGEIDLFIIGKKSYYQIEIDEGLKEKILLFNISGEQIMK